MGFTRRSVVRIDCKRDPETICEQLRHAYETLENRFGELINEEGQLTGNLPPDVSVGGPAGDIPLGEITLIFEPQNPEQWDKEGEIQVDPDIVDPEAIAMTGDGSIFITAQDAVSAGTVEFWESSNFLPSPKSFGSITDAALDLPNSLMVVNPDGRFVFVLGLATGRKLSLIDFQEPTKPELLSTLDLTGQLQSAWTDALWDQRNRILWIVDGTTTDTIWGVSIEVNGQMKLAVQFTDTSNMNRPKSLNLSDTGNTLYVGQRGRLASVDISDLTSISVVDTEFMPSGSEDVFNLAREYGRLAFTTNATTPATIRVATVDPDDEQQITLAGSTSMPVGDATQRNQGAGMNGSIFNFVTRPEGVSALITVVNCFEPAAPYVVDQLDTLQGGAVARYYQPQDHIWLQYFRPAGAQTFVATYKSGKTSVEDISDPDTAYQRYSARAAYFQAWVQNGKAPFETFSQTVNINFNADLLDGLHANEVVQLALDELVPDIWYWGDVT